MYKALGSITSTTKERWKEGRKKENLIQLHHVISRMETIVRAKILND
jgi:hypothetical protein